MDRPVVGSIWQRLDGKAPVRIGRCWRSDSFCGGGDFVRCHPLRGGKVWFTTIEEFLKRYTLRHSDGGEG